MERVSKSLIEDLVNVYHKINQKEKLSKHELGWGNVCASFLKIFVNIRWKYGKEMPLEEWEKEVRGKMGNVDKGMLLILFQEEISSQQLPYNLDKESYVNLNINPNDLLSDSFVTTLVERLNNYNVSKEGLQSLKTT